MKKNKWEETKLSGTRTALGGSWVYLGYFVTLLCTSLGAFRKARCPQISSGGEPTLRTVLFLPDHSGSLTLATASPPAIHPTTPCAPPLTGQGTQTPRLFGVTCSKSLNALVAESRILRKTASYGVCRPPAWVHKNLLTPAFLSGCRDSS